MVDRYKMIDLCAGTGGFSCAFEKTNKINVIYANDMEKTSKIIYDKNFDHELTLSNLTEIKINSIPDHDILTAGFSCQPFSIAGVKKGFDDDRSEVIWKILDIVKEKKPKCFIFENVKNFISHDNGKTLETLIKKIEEIKYCVKYKVLNTSKVTKIPQNRERVYFVCFSDKKNYDRFNFNFSEKEKDNIDEYLENHKVNDKYYYNDKNNKIHKMVMDNVTDKNKVYQFRRKYVRENKKNECPTLTANMGTGGHNVPIIRDDYGVRKLTPRECFNLQGFSKKYKLPKNISDAKLYKLSGNAITVKVAYLIAKKVINCLL